MSGATAECTWGDGPDVCVTVRRDIAFGYGWIPYPDSDTKDAGSFGLSAPEALALAAQLVQAAVAATRLAGYLEAGRPRVNPPPPPTSNVP